MIVSLALSALLLGAEPGGALTEGGPLLHRVQEAPAAEAAPAPAPARRRPARRRAARRAAPPPVAEAPPPPPAASFRQEADIAPMPNRSLEAPRGPTLRDETTLRPDLIEPRNLPDGRVQPGNNYTERQDRLFRDPAAGARLNIPFSY